MSLQVDKVRVTRLLAAALLGIIVSAVLLAGYKSARGTEIAAVSGAEFCATSPADARATPQDRAAVMFTAAVPLDSVASAPTEVAPVAATQGDVVRVTVRSPRDGGVAVHGLLDVRPIAAQQQVTVEFRAIYSGRYPIHFHGADGSHIEIAAIEVTPNRFATAQKQVPSDAQAFK